MRFAAAVCLLAASAVLVAAPQPPSPYASTDPFHRPLDQVLDTLVRDGLVYYNALKSERGRLDDYVRSLDVSPATYDGWTREQQMAFWVNAYNAFVLETVINHYPIRGRSDLYPSNSIRQIPGAFEKTTWRAAGKRLTLDEIEKTILPEFHEPRLYLALGRGAVGGGRLRSEAYTAARLAGQLDAIRKEFATERELMRIDRDANVISLTPVVSWHEQEFVAAYDRPDGDAAFAARSPIERAIIAFIRPDLLPLEKQFVTRNQFRVVFHDFDWRLNDLTGGRD
ncbi:MAG TPA: DUF547 domain-containing protein [Vicinamibacterales bacterium]|nr:DUF547 domain-containing protein [Vicinamibacterales bacterium]